MSITKVSHIHHHYEDVGESVLSPMRRQNKYLEKSFNIKKYIVEPYEYFGRFFRSQYKNIVENKKGRSIPYLVNAFLEMSYNSLSTLSENKVMIEITPSLE